MTKTRYFSGLQPHLFYTTVENGIILQKNIFVNPSKDIS